MIQINSGHIYLLSISAIISKASSWTETSSCFAIALVRRPVIFLHTLAASAEPLRGVNKKKLNMSNLSDICTGNQILFKTLKRALLRKKMRKNN